MTNEEDNILIEKIILYNDNNASNKLYTWYYKEVKNFIQAKYKKLSEDDVNDISSDTISKSFVNLPKFDSTKSSFKTWICTIAENLVIDYSRKLENRIDKVHYHYLEEADEQNFDIPSTENHEETYLIKEIVDYGISKLDHTMNDMVKKKYIEGYSNDEIGKIYAITGSSVKNKIHYAKSQIRNRMADSVKKKRTEY